MDMLWHVSLPFQCINEHRAAFLVITQSLCHTKMPAALQEKQNCREKQKQDFPLPLDIREGGGKHSYSCSCLATEMGELRMYDSRGLSSSITKRRKEENKISILITALA